jgi:hypothetical protein
MIRAPADALAAGDAPVQAFPGSERFGPQP